MERQFPIHGFFSYKMWRQIRGFTLPWGLLAPHNEQAKKNHCGQDLEKLASRGGLGMHEVIAVIDEHEIRLMDQETTLNRLSELVRAYEQTDYYKDFGVNLDD